jgi:hypothetical protein
LADGNNSEDQMADHSYIKATGKPATVKTRSEALTVWEILVIEKALQSPELSTVDPASLQSLKNKINRTVTGTLYCRIPETIAEA